MNCASPTDPFLLLDLPRRPKVDLFLLEEKVRHLAAAHHPDQAMGNNALFLELQEAATLLREPANRLRYLACSSEKSHSLAPQAATLFSTIHTTISTLDLLLASYHKAQTTLAKAVLIQELVTAREQLKQTTSALENWSNTLSQELHQLDQRWPKVTSQELLELADNFSFATRWKNQLQERKLSMTIILKK